MQSHCPDVSLSGSWIAKIVASIDPLNHESLATRLLLACLSCLAWRDGRGALGYRDVAALPVLPHAAVRAYLRYVETDRYKRYAQ